MNRATSGALFVVAGCAFGAICTVETKYLEQNSLSWVQTFILCQISSLSFCCTFGILFQLYQYHSNQANFNPFIKHLLYVFPSKTNNNYGFYHQWQTMVVCGLAWGLAMQFFTIGLLYMTAGDCLLLRIVISVIGIVLVAVIYFKERLTWPVYVAFCLALIGLILVCQPGFIFGNNDGDSVSLIGLLFVFIAGMCQTANKSFMKYSGTIEIDWLAMSIVKLTICVIISLIDLLCLIVYYYYCYNGKYDDKSMSFIWIEYIWTDLGLTDGLTKFVIVAYGFTMVGALVCMVIGFQIGSLGRLSIVYTTDIPLTYMLQDWLLNEDNDYITYIGVAVTIISVFIIFWETHKQSESNNDSIRIVDADSDHDVSEVTSLLNQTTQE